jgi:hypothetical protein
MDECDGPRFDLARRVVGAARRGVVVAVLLGVVLLVLSGCAQGAGASPAGAPSAAAAPSSGPSASPTPADACPGGRRLSRPDRAVHAQYPITGYFVFTDVDRCATRATVQGAHAIGADTLVTFGAVLRPVTLEELRSPADGNPFAHFRVRGADGYEHAVGQTVGGSIRTVYTYANKTAFTDAALPCEHDGRSRTPRGVFTWWLLPVEGGYSDCESPSRTYDLVVSYNASAVDADTVLVSDAARFGMKVYLGMPRPRPDPAVPYVADTSYTQTLGAFTTRVLADWDAKFGDLDAFAGAYQTIETGVFTNAAVWEPNLRLYELQNRIVGFRLPEAKRRVVVSPYADLRRGVVPVSAIRPALQLVADTADAAEGVTLILAPQDGAGTGRVGLFRPEEAGEPVRPDLRGVVGETTYGEAYAGSTATLYAEARKVEGAELWANIEAFRPPGRVGDRAPSELGVLDTQVELAAPHVEKVIAYRWDDYLDESGLADEIRSR